MDFTLNEAQDELAGLARKILAQRGVGAGARAHPGRSSTQSGTRRNGSGPTWPRPACSRPGCPRRSAGRGSACSSTVRSWPRSAGPSRDVPYLASIVLGAGAIAEFGSPPQQRQWVVPAGQGSVVLTAALAEEDGDDPRIPSASATRRNGRWVLSGVKTAVPAAPRADLLLVPASTADGVLVFLVEPSDAGVTVEPQRLTDFAEAGRVVLDGVTLDDDRVLGAGRARSRTGWWPGAPWGCARRRPGSSSGRSS